MHCRYVSAEHYAAALVNYHTACTVVLGLMILQLMRHLDFQPKLSLITRTVSAAWTDLVHFFMLFVMVEVAFTALGALFCNARCRLAGCLVGWSLAATVEEEGDRP